MEEINRGCPSMFDWHPGLCVFTEEPLLNIDFPDDPPTPLSLVPTARDSAKFGKNF
jgi:hypothetical protein